MNCNMVLNAGKWFPLIVIKVRGLPLTKEGSPSALYLA